MVQLSKSANEYFLVPAAKIFSNMKENRKEAAIMKMMKAETIQNCMEISDGADRQVASAHL